MRGHIVLVYERVVSDSGQESSVISYLATGYRGFALFSHDTATLQLFNVIIVLAMCDFIVKYDTIVVATLRFSYKHQKYKKMYAV